MALVPQGQLALAQTPEQSIDRERENRQYQHLLSVAESQEQRLARFAALRTSPGYDLSDPWLVDASDKKAAGAQQELLLGAPCRLVGSGEIAAYLGVREDGGGCSMRLADGTEALRARGRILPLPTQPARQGDWVYPVNLQGTQVQYHGRKGLCGLGGIISGPPRRQGFWVSFEPSDETLPPEVVLIDIDHLVTLPLSGTGTTITPWEARCSVGGRNLPALLDGVPALTDERAKEEQLMLRYGECADDEESVAGSVAISSEGEQGDEAKADNDDDDNDETNLELSEGCLVRLTLDGRLHHARVERGSSIATICAKVCVLDSANGRDAAFEVPWAHLTPVSEDDLVLSAVCRVCGSAEPETSLVLCDNFAKACLFGIHLACCSPPLTAVPEGAWLCQACNSGSASSSSAANGATATATALKKNTQPSGTRKRKCAAIADEQPERHASKTGQRRGGAHGGTCQVASDAIVSSKPGGGRRSRGRGAR